MSEAAHISGLGNVLGERVYVKCLLTALANFRVAKRGAGSKSRVWSLPDSTLHLFAIYTIINDMGVEEAIGRFPKEFDALGYNDHRQVFAWVERLREFYAREVDRKVQAWADEIDEIPADGNATGQHLRLVSTVQGLLNGMLSETGDLTEVDSKTMNAISKLIDSMNKAIDVCSRVPLTEAKARQVASKIKGEIDAASANGTPISEEAIAEKIHSLIMGGDDGADGGAS